MQGLDLDTSGFYKYYDDQKAIIYAPNFVHTPNGVISRDNTSEELDGQKFYSSEYDAYIANGMDTTNMPIEITRMQFKLVLFRRGILDQVEYIISQASPEAQLIYKELLHIRRNSTMLKSIANALGYSEIDLDTLFNEAKNIEP